MESRILVSWENGAYINSLHPNFQKELLELLEQFGQPDSVELINQKAVGWCTVIEKDDPREFNYTVYEDGRVVDERSSIVYDDFNQFMYCMNEKPSFESCSFRKYTDA